MSQTTPSTISKTKELFHPLPDSSVTVHSDTESSSSDHSETNDDVMRLVNSTRKLLRTSSQEKERQQNRSLTRCFGSGEHLCFSKPCLNETRSNPTQLDTIPSLSTTRSSMESPILQYDDSSGMDDFEAAPRKPVSLQNLNFGNSRSHLTDPIWDGNSAASCETQLKLSPTVSFITVAKSARFIKIAVHLKSPGEFREHLAIAGID